MAESAVSSAANLLGKILVEEGKYLWGAEEKVEELRDELLWMQSFLREADTLQHIDESVRMWVSQIREHVYEAEDIIEDFVIKVVSCRRRNSLLDKLKRYSCILGELYYLHQAASSIDSLKVKISTLSPKMEKYGLKRSLGINTDQAQEALTQQVQQSLKYVHLEQKKIVGLDKNAAEITTVLKVAKRGYHAFYGMGGLGKTTLATKVLQSDEVKQHFIGGQAFVYVSKQFQVQSVLQDVLKGLNIPSSENGSVSDLQQALKKKKCLVVLDDVWTQQAWDVLRSAFTACEGDSGSKILLTTRNEEVAKYVDPKALQKPDPLSQDESWELLQKTMGWDPIESSRYENDRIQIIGISEVDKKMKVGYEMVRACNGLPLAIVVLGGILRKRQTLSEWETVHKNLTSYLRMGYDHGRTCMEILLHSYTDLPYHLKSCFLHLAGFPEDYEIETDMLYRMWIGEGLVARSGNRKSDLEEVANDYLNELALVGLVQIEYKTEEGWIKSIRIHDLVRDVCLEKATGDDFLKVIDLRPDSDDQVQQNTFDCRNSKRLLRMSIYLPKKGRNEEGSCIRDSVTSKAHKYLRSILLINELYADEVRSGELMEIICNEFQMLRVLVLQNLVLRGELSSKVGNLMHLRYLCFRRVSVDELPSSIGNLRFLETLELDFYDGVTIPNILWKLFQLRHLILPYRYQVVQGSSEKLRLDTLIKLETIENLNMKNHRTKDLLKMKNLKKVETKKSMEVSDEEVIRNILSAVQSAGNLGSYSLNVEGETLSKNPSILSEFVGKLVLQIRGHMSVLGTGKVELSKYLIDLSLTKCELKDDPWGYLGSLTHLKHLWLDGDCYVGNTISFHSNTFPALISLRIHNMKRLEVWEGGHGSMPKLEMVWVMGSFKLKRIPDVLPSSLKALFFYSVRGSADYSEVESLLRRGDKNVVLLGKGGAGKSDLVMKLCEDQKVVEHFDYVAKICVPRMRKKKSILPRRSLVHLLIQLQPFQTRGRFNEMSSASLIAEIQRFLKSGVNCLLIFEDADCLEDLVNTFGVINDQADALKSTLLITSESISLYDDMDKDEYSGFKFYKLRPPPNLETLILPDIKEDDCGDQFYVDDFWDKKAGIKWNVLSRYSGHPLSVIMLKGLLKTREDITECADILEMLSGPTPLEFPQIFTLCYNDLPLHLRSCLIYLASFPEDIEIHIRKLFRMWIAAGFVRPKHDDDQSQTEENVASAYLTELVQGGMVIVRKRGRAESVKTCQLKFALRDLCLERAKEEHILMIVDQFEDTISTNCASNAKLKTQQLAIHLDQYLSPAPDLLDERLRFLENISSPISLLVFSDLDDPLHNEDNWEWLLYLCKHWQLLRVLDLESMWMTKGRLPKEIGTMRQLRYLSLKGTWVTELPTSVANLIKLQTLDLRVKGSISIPDVLWKLNFLTHLYLPEAYQLETEMKLQLSGMKSLQTLVNLDTHTLVCLNDLVELKLLSKLSIRKIHEVDEFDDILKSLGPSLDLCIDSNIINENSTILSTFRNMRKVKIKGEISVELAPEMFPPDLEELTLKHTMLRNDPLVVLEKLPKLTKLSLEDGSFIGETMTLSDDFHDRAFLTLSGLGRPMKLYLPDKYSERVEIIDCWLLTKEWLINNGTNTSDDESEQVPEQNSKRPSCLDKSPLKKGLQAFTCW